MPVDKDNSTVSYPLYVLSDRELAVVASLLDLERDFESYDLADDGAKIYDAHYRRVEVDQNRPFQENSFKVSLDNRYSALEGRFWMRTECIQMCLRYVGVDVDNKFDRVFSMDMAELMTEVTRLREELGAESAAWIAAAKKPQPDWIARLFRR